MKKTLIILMAAMVLAVSCVPLIGMAETTSGYQISGQTVTVDDIFTVDVAIKDNPGIISLRFKVAYDTDKLELLEVSDKALLNGFTTPSPTISSPYTLRWADSLALSNNTANGTVVTLKFKALKETSATTISIEHGESRDANGNKVLFNNAIATIKIDSAPAYILGDVTGDGVINQYDYICVKRHCMGTFSIEESSLAAADVTGDGKVDQYDYIYIKRHCMGTYTIG